MFCPQGQNFSEGGVVGEAAARGKEKPDDACWILGRAAFAGSNLDVFAARDAFGQIGVSEKTGAERAHDFAFHELPAQGAGFVFAIDAWLRGVAPNKTNGPGRRAGSF